MHNTRTLANASTATLTSAAAFAAAFAASAADPADIADAVDVVRHAVRAVEELVASGYHPGADDRLEEAQRSCRVAQLRVQHRWLQAVDGDPSEADREAAMRAVRIARDCYARCGALRQVRGDGNVVAFAR